MNLATTTQRRMLRWGLLALTALVAGGLGSVIVLIANDAAGNPVVGWLGDWVKSPGFTGLGAIVAAAIAFVGISRQVQFNRERDADAAWWESFEWASDRGLPRDTSALRLPFEAALDTLNALATAARTDIQKEAVRGVVDEVIRLHKAKRVEQESAVRDSVADSPTSSAERSEGDTSERIMGDGGEGIAALDDSAFAILRYVQHQTGTAAESRRASYSAYESEVLRALKHQYGRVISLPGDAAGDVIVNTRSRQLSVEIKWSPNAVINMPEFRDMNKIDVVISNVRVVRLPPGVYSVVWKPGDSSFVLRQALDAIG